MPKGRLHWIRRPRFWIELGLAAVVFASVWMLAQTRFGDALGVALLAAGAVVCVVAIRVAIPAYRTMWSDWGDDEPDDADHKE